MNVGNVPKTLSKLPHLGLAEPGRNLLELGLAKLLAPRERAVPHRGDRVRGVEGPELLLLVPAVQLDLVELRHLKTWERK